VKRPIRPKQGWPWEAQGFTFSIPGFPPLYEPQPYKPPQDLSGISTRSRNTMLERGDTGSIKGGLSARSSGVVSDPRRALVK
jgi:hypothetical protein